MHPTGAPPDVNLFPLCSASYAWSMKYEELKAKGEQKWFVYTFQILVFSMIHISECFECEQIYFCSPFAFNSSHFLLHAYDAEHKGNKFAYAAYSKNGSISMKMHYMCMSRQCASLHCTVQSSNRCNVSHRGCTGGVQKVNVTPRRRATLRLHDVS